MHLRFSLWRYGDKNSRLSECCQIDVDKTIKALNTGFVETDMRKISFITLRDNPSLKEVAAEWFHSKWGVPIEAYLECMRSIFGVHGRLSEQHNRIRMVSVY